MVKRVRKACDRCSSARTRCDGKQPCQRCSGMAVACEYTRQLKRRGKGSDLYPTKSKARKTETSTANGTEANGTSSLPPPSAPPQQPTVYLDSTVGAPFGDAAHSYGHIGHSGGSSTSPGASSTSEYNKQEFFGDPHLAHVVGSPSGPMISESAFNSPRWINLNTPFPAELFTTGFETKERQALSSTLSYPVLNAVAHQLSFIDPELVADLLVVYFSNTVYGVAPIIRRSSILSLTSPRQCSPALLFSFLLVSAHASDHPKIKATPSTREKIIHKLTDLVIRNLGPLQEISGQGTLDDIIACIHLGIVTSASEFKGESMKWWNTAYSLARVLKLNIENDQLDEERREEQRRSWWLLFLVDRHLALCYNLPVSLDETECLDLYVPLDETVWVGDEPLLPTESNTERKKGPPFVVYSTGLFGMYLPFMVLLGRILQIHFMTLNPHLDHKEEVIKLFKQSFLTRLDAMERSVEEFMADSPNPSIYSVTWKEYCRCYIHIFHILVQGHWDPINLMDSIPSLLKTQEFGECVKHSILATKCLERVLTVDPDLRLIPYFFGIQLLLTGVTLLCVADHLDKDMSNEIRYACEVVVRAHEVCIVTLNTEYQRNFRAILRGAIQAFVFPELADGLEERRARRREVLALYRWCSGRTGLAI
ncbi:hypothetical protein TRVA0_020S02476 [Trichomonascus vanleenenianus]|uniref:uncharacterized protein n=1 Tax=Trichomonascus vanleenenianus TaxID=2268995 RepID=UPI003EC9C793